jgi:DNA-binding LacI/PurR family transcriptional regulator
VTIDRGRQKRPTLVDVAKLAGVSHQTVSRYLHVPERLKPHTFSVVKAAIETLDYHPNLLARSMRTRRKGILAIVMPGHTMPYSPARVLASATAEAHRNGFQVETVSVEGGARERSERIMELISSDLVEGVLSLAEVEGLENLRAHGIVEVSADYDDNLNGIGPLLDAGPIREIVTRMAELGHRRVLHIGGPEHHPASIERRRVFLQITDELGLVQEGVTTGPWEGGYARDVILGLASDTLVTAVVAGNDELAAGAIAGAATRGWRVPARLSVSGWDDNSVGAFMPPALTTVRVDHSSLGESGMSRLIAAVRGSEPDGAPPRPLNTVIWRDSVGPAPVLGDDWAGKDEASLSARVA